MKIGLIGNMNNNNFALMRYFRDLGADAHLLLYSNDGKGSLSHFNPEADTWEIEKWRHFIHQTNIPNAPISAVNLPISWLLVLRSYFITKQDITGILTSHTIKQAYEGYDRLLASGITPATLRRVGLKLDIFYPYSSGVEFLKTGEYLVRQKNSSWFHRFIYNYIAKRQADGIKLSRFVLNAELGLTDKVLCGLGIKPVNISIPMVYNREKKPEKPPSKYIEDIFRVIKRTDISILSHSRLMWSNDGSYSKEEWFKENKNNDWLIHSIKEIVLCKPDIKICLFMVEYGPDVDRTKKLVNELGIDDYVFWLPKMERKNIIWLLNQVTVGVGEFYEVPRMIWGGTGWEVLSCGRPLLQGYHFDNDEFEQLYGYEPPPILKVKTREDVFNHLMDMVNHPEKAKEIGLASQKWFNSYNGLNLAKQWLDLIQNR